MNGEPHLLATGSYDLVLGGTIIGSVVRAVTCDGDCRGWHAELLDELPPERRPHPFSKIQHRFATFKAVTSWLNDAVIVNEIASA